MSMVAIASLSLLLPRDPLNRNTMLCRLFRLLKPVSQLWLFSDLEIIFHALSSALLPMLTVMSLISFVFILMSIIGMSLYGERSFQRRCVWAGKCCIDVNSIGGDSSARNSRCIRIANLHASDSCRGLTRATCCRRPERQDTGGWLLA